MHGYLLTMIILGVIGALLNVLLLAMDILPSAPTRGMIASRLIIGVAFTLWATYLLIQGN